MTRPAKTAARRIAAAIAVLVLVGGCGPEGGSPAADGAATATTKPPMPDHLVADTGAEGTLPGGLDPGWVIDIQPPGLAKESLTVVSGRVVGVERSFVNGIGDVGTVYSFQVDAVHHGEDVADVISISLSGGTMPLGEYIAGLDELGISEMRLGCKDLDRDGVPDGGCQDPRTADPATPVTHNRGLNPASAVTLDELQPDLWVFYLGGREDGAYHLTAAPYGMKYLRDGQVHSLPSEQVMPPFPASQLDLD